MSRYSPSVRLDAGGPLDFSPLTSALRDLQDTRLRKRQLSLYEAREAEDNRQQAERERIAGEARANDVRRRGGVPILEAPIGQPTIRDLTPSTAAPTRVPQALGGGELRTPLARSSGGDWRPEGTGRYQETIDGTTYLVDPLQPLRLQDKVRRDTERATLESAGRVSRSLLSTIPTYQQPLSRLSDEDLGRLPLSELDTLTRAATPKALTARDDIAGQAKAFGVDVTGMSPGEAATRVAMAEDKWKAANRPSTSDDENRALIREERVRKARESLAHRVVQSAKALGLGTLRDAYADKRIWNARDAAEAKRLGMTHADYMAAWQAYDDSPSTASARAARADTKGGGVQALIADALKDDAPSPVAGGARAAGRAPARTPTRAPAGEPSEDDFVRALQALGPNATEAQARAWLAAHPARR